MRGRRALAIGALLGALATGCSESSAPPQVAPEELESIDFVVVPATPAVRDRIANSTLVDAYAILPKGSALDATYRGLGFGFGSAASQASCDLLDAEGIALHTADDIILKFITGLVGGDVRVYESFRSEGFQYASPETQLQIGQLDIFMAANASRSSIEQVRDALEADPAVESVRYVDRQAAWEQFRGVFDETSSNYYTVDPESLAESFRVTARAGADVDSLARRFAGGPGVDTVQRAEDRCR